MSYIIILLKNQIFQTIITAVSIYILSQYFLQGFIQPRVELKKLHAILSERILFYQEKITNGSLSEAEIKEIREASTKMLSHAWGVYILKYKRNQYVNISREINGLLFSSISRDNKDIMESVMCLKNLRKYKFLKVSFE